jgi:hypothetical protein
VRSRRRMLVLISADSVQRPSRTLDSAPWSGEPNPTGLWAPIAPALYKGGGGYRGKDPEIESCPLTHLSDPTDRESAENDGKSAAPASRHRCHPLNLQRPAASTALANLAVDASTPSSPWSTTPSLPAHGRLVCYLCFSL